MILTKRFRLLMYINISNNQYKNLKKNLLEKSCEWINGNDREVKEIRKGL